MYRSILLPLDGSAFAEHAIPCALEIARLAGAVLHPVRVYVLEEPWRTLETITPYPFEFEPAAELGRLWEASCTLLTVVPPSDRLNRADSDSPTATGESPGCEAARAYLDGVARKLRATWSHVDVRVVEETHAATAILEEAGSMAADVLAVPTHGHGGLVRIILGSVADKLVRGSTVPVLIRRPTDLRASLPTT